VALAGFAIPNAALVGFEKSNLVQPYVRLVFEMV